MTAKYAMGIGPASILLTGLLDLLVFPDDARNPFGSEEDEDHQAEN